MTNFADRLVEAIKAKNSVVCVGLDPVLERIPGPIVGRAQEEQGPTLIAAAEAILNFNKGLIDAIADIVPCVKPQVAFYEQYGFHGMWAFEETCKYAQEKGLLVIADVKRNDIGSTAKAYAEGLLGEVDVFGKPTQVGHVDAATVNAYLGHDGVAPFVEVCKEHDKGIFVLVKTSNPSSGDIQDRSVDDCDQKVHELLAQMVDSWGADEVGEHGFSSIGAVVGATYPQELADLREVMPNAFFLVPGFGAQGGTAEDVKGAFKDGLGAVVNSSRGINYAYEKDEKMGAAGFAEAARNATMRMNEELNAIR